MEALRVYCAHPWRAPPADTYELLKLIMRETKISSADLSVQFRAQVKKVQSTQMKTEMPWEEFWDTVGKGEILSASKALSTSKSITGAEKTNFVILCGKLLEAVGLDGLKKMPFAYVTKTNIITAALEKDHFPLAIHMLELCSIQRKDAEAIWPIVAKYSWQQGLQFIQHFKKSSITKDFLLCLLEKGTPLMLIVSYLEYNGGLNQKAIIDALIEHAISIKDYEFVKKGIAHLEDIDLIAPQVHKAFLHHAELYTLEKVCDGVMRNNCKFSELTVEKIERMCA